MLTVRSKNIHHDKQLKYDHKALIDPTSPLPFLEKSLFKTTTTKINSRKLMLNVYFKGKNNNRKTNILLRDVLKII